MTRKYDRRRMRLIGENRADTELFVDKYHHNNMHTIMRVVFLSLMNTCFIYLTYSSIVLSSGGYHGWRSS
jgi:hypothetical protein